MYTKNCTKCDSEFQTNVYRQLKCRPECGRTRVSAEKNRVREIARANHEVEFIGVDGEGVNNWAYVVDYDDETNEEVTRRIRKHEYVLLSVGDQSLHKNGDSLTHDEIFGFLWEQFLAHPTAAFVGFFLGYDFTNWLKSLPEHSARSLLTKEGIARRQPGPDSERHTPWPVRDGHWGYSSGRRVLVNQKWEFDILGPKRFQLRPYVKPEDVPTRIVNHKDGTQSEERIPRPWMYICDAGPFFQTSFMNVINPKKWPTPVLSAEEHETIARGKENRETAVFDEDMIRYNVLENDVLARVMEKLNEGFVSDGVRLTRKQWFGPGQAAQAWMRINGVPTGEEIREVVPEYAREAAIKTYYGGWFEIFNHGPVPGTSYAYDINSAYPAVIAELPCLLHGKWSEGRGRQPRSTARGIRMLYVDVEGKDSWVGPVPHRDRDGCILRPSKTRGWYWKHELDESKRAGLISKMTVLGWVNYEPCDCPPPMARITELYQGRIDVGKESPEGKAKKLLYNSMYGKLAQSIGNPRFSNPIWASLITAGCRTMILGAIATHPTKTATLLMVATDGIVFKDPHPAMDIHPERLGAWSEETYENLSLFMPGLYWHDEARDDIRAGLTPKLKSRGVAPKDLGKFVDYIDREWIRFGQNPDKKPPVARLTIPWAITSAKQAIVRNKWMTCGRIDYDIPRVLDGNPASKRDPNVLAFATDSLGGIRSQPYAFAAEPETTYYDKGFGEDLTEEDDIDQMEHPDGLVGDLRAWMFGLR